MDLKTLGSRNCKAFFILLITALFSLSLHARQLDDVIFPDNVTLAGTDATIQLNGMGYRTKFIFKVYVGGLYTQSKVNSRDAVQALTGPRRIIMHMIHDEVSRKKMTAAWNEGFEENNTAEQLEKLNHAYRHLSVTFPI